MELEEKNLPPEKAPVARRRLLGCLGRSVTGIMAFMLAMLVFLAAGIFGITGGLLAISGRDVSIGPENVPFWPEWLTPRELLRDYAWAWLVGGVLLVLIFLPLLLALLEKLVLAIQRRTR